MKRFLFITILGLFIASPDCMFLQLGNLTDVKFAFSSLDMLDKDTRLEVFFDINLYSTVTFRHGLDNGKVSFGLIGLENIDTKEKYFPNYINDQIDYCDYEYKLSGGRYKVIVLAIVEIEDYFHEIYYQCSVEPETIEKDV